MNREILPGQRNAQNNRMPRSRRTWTALAVALTLTWLAGCAAPVRYVELDSKPDGATIFINGEEKGVTPSERIQLDFANRPQGRVIIQVVKDRYRPVFQSWTLQEVPEKKTFTLESY